MFKFNENIIEVIFGIAILLGTFLFLTLLIIRKNKYVKDLNKIQKEQPMLKQKVRILKSRHMGTAEKNKEFETKSFRIVIFIFILIILFIIIGNRINIDNRIIMYSLIAVLIIFIIYTKKRDKKQKNSINTYIKSSLYSAYGPLTEEPLQSPKIIYGKKNKEGNIKNTHVFSYKIQNVNCLLNNYYLEKVVKQSKSNGNSLSLYRYYYMKIKNVFEYYYDLQLLGLSNISNEILNNEIVKKNIENLSKTRIINVSIKDKFLLIEKETVLFNYEEKDADIDVKDVGIFYDELVKCILETNK